MKLQVEIDLDNAAFQDGGTNEAIRCITQALEKLRGRWALVGDRCANVTDLDGNKVGAAQISE